MGGHHRCVWGTVRLVARRASQFNNPAPRLLTLFPDHRHCSGRAFSVSAPSHASPSLDPGVGLYSSLADTAPVLLAEHLLAATQASLGLPWWATIACSTVALRSCVTLPLTVYQMHVMAKLSALQQEISELARLLRRDVSVTARQRGWPESTARFEFRKELKRLVSELYVRDNCHPVKTSLIMWVQIPLWIILTVSLQNISRLAQDESSVYGGLLEGGMLWFSNLTLPDATWILPISLGLINLLIVEMFALQRKDMSRMQRLATNFIRLLSIVMVPVAAAVPSAVSLYWVSSSAVGLAQNLALRAPRVRSLLHLPRSPMDSETPYRDLARSFRSKIMDRGGSAETPKARR
ncbi:cytochrome c oxidase assembly protein COX18, mitochondrial-like [Lethenteron reissneri]|uniref:cytochrome c oxidase assembly protein COX18, mitochondrial-like n=1 Tax=Lethenteron reissneri TaxID=7753 RepID=UPI002AB74804|nr:cytochrome c oxidase assembly protein COX18, mitochondrial-like [Lethenteron reissneri]